MDWLLYIIGGIGVIVLLLGAGAAMTYGPDYPSITD